MLVYGGESPEHDVSIKSAHNVYAAIDNNKYTVRLCFIDKVGRWWLTESVDGHYIGCPHVVPLLGQGAFFVPSTKATIKPDVIFPVLHGANGEDGTVQGLARLLHIPYVGPSLLGSAITMDKDVTKRLLRDADIPVVPWVVIRKDEERPRFEAVTKELGRELFVKPASAGSSVGAHKVKSGLDFRSALADAFKYDHAVLIESAVDAHEIELAVLGNESPKVSGAGEIVPGEEFYNYDDKYSDSSVAKIVIPAQLEKETVSQLQGYALKAYRATCGQGMARVDFFIDKKTNAIYLNEINSIPGFTNISMYPKLWHEAGVSYGQLVDELIQLAIKSSV